mmetsp:Transcript_13602/g.19596  ORF Transcript_13602/g.19596 Transcript_13602/m.19596 type:complete len:88 (-) Transcript_13602:109-372(-)
MKNESVQRVFKQQPEDMPSQGKLDEQKRVHGLGGEIEAKTCNNDWYPEQQGYIPGALRQTLQSIVLEHFYGVVCCRKAVDPSAVFIT